MRIRTRTAVLACAGTVLLTLGGAAALLLRPERLRTTLTAFLQGALEDGFVAEIDRVSWSFADGLTAEGVRIHDASRGRTLVDVPRLRIATRAWALLRELRVTDVRVERPTVEIERLADGGFVLARAFRPPPPPDPAAPAEPVATPRLRVDGGVVRYIDPLLLAEGAPLLLDLERVEVQESHPGRPVAVEATLRDAGPGGAGGAGALGRVVVRGRWPPGREGLRVAVQEFHAGDPLRDRLSAEVRRTIESVAMEGPFGSADGLPGLEVVLEERDGGDAVAVRVVARPSDLAVVVDGFPAVFTGVSGEIAWSDGILTISDIGLRRSGAEIHAKGTVDLRRPDDPAMDLRFWARGLYLDHELRAALPAGVRRVWDAYDFGGTVDVTEAAPDEEASFDSHVVIPGGGRPADVKVAVNVRDGFLAYKGMPDARGVRHGFDYPATDVRGRVDVRSDGTITRIALRDIEGRHGDVRIRAAGEVVDNHAGRSQVEIHVVARDVPLDRHLANAFDTTEVFDTWSPEGTAAEIHVIVLQDMELDRHAYENVVVHFDGRASFSYAGFPLRLHGVEGVVEERKDRVSGALVPRTSLQAIRGTTGDGATVLVDGTVQGPRDDRRVNLAVRVQDLVLDSSLRAALAADPARAPAVAAWDDLGPSGRASGRADVSGTERDPVVALRIDLDGRATVRGWGDVRRPVENLHGTVTVEPGRVVLREVRGMADHGEVRIPSGLVETVGGGTRLDLVIEADDFPLDASVRASLGPVGERAAAYFDVVRPQPGLRADLRVHLTGDAGGPAARVVATNVQGGLAPLGLRNLDVGAGRVVVDGGVVTLDGIEASMANRDLVVRQGRLDLDAGAGALAFEVRRLRWPGDLIGVIEPSTAAAIEALAPDRYFHVETLRVDLADGWRTVTLDGDLSLSPQRAEAARGLGLEGVFGLRGLTFRRGPAEGDAVEVSGRVYLSEGVILAGVPMRGITATLDLSGTIGGAGTDVRAAVSGLAATLGGRALDRGSTVLRFRDGSFLAQDLRARFAGGELSAAIEAPFGRQKYKVTLALQGAGARELFAPDDPLSPLAGRVSGNLTVNNPTDDPATLNGTVTARIENARLFEVPVFAAIYGVLPGAPTPVFESGSLDARIRGDEIVLDAFALRSPVLDIEKAKGGSRIYFDGRLDVGVNPVIKQVRGIPLVGPFLDPLLSAVLGPVVQRIWQTRVTGTVQNPVAATNLFPGILGVRDDRYHVLPPPPVVEPTARPPVEW